MAEIRNFLAWRHLRAEPSSFVLHYKNGELRRSGRGAAFWFRALDAAIVEVPVDDRELTFLFHGRSADFQDLSVQGVLSYRVVAPSTLAERIDFGIDVRLRALKPPVLNGAAGLSQKSADPGNASYYYSVPRMQTEGSIHVDGREFTVSGLSWLDREWSTSALSEGQVGWDWFSIQLDDGRELMLYRLRREDGSVDPFDSGTLVGTDGSVRRLGSGDVTYAPVKHWESPQTGARYPVEWRLVVEPLDIELDVTPLLPGSEMDVSVRYWEGAVDVNGTRNGVAISGRGYVELTGYAD